MFPSADKQPTTTTSSSDDEEERGVDTISPEKLEEYRQLYQDQFSMMCSNPDMWELIVPYPLPKKEQKCIKEVAQKLDLLTQLVPGNGMRVYKKDLPEMEAFVDQH